MKCKGCNEIINPGEKFCTNCGLEVKRNQIDKKYIIGGTVAVLVLVLCSKMFGGSATYETPFHDFKTAMNAADSKLLKECFIPKMVYRAGLNNMTDAELKEEAKVEILDVIVIRNGQDFKKEHWDVLARECIAGFITDTSTYSGLEVVNVEYKCKRDGELSTRSFKDILVV